MSSARIRTLVLTAIAVCGGMAATTGAGAASADEPPLTVNGCTIVADPTPKHHTSCRGADLRFAGLVSKNLRHADLVGADLTGTNFTDADLSFANLSDANLTDAIFLGSRRDTVIMFERDINVFGIIVGDLNITTEPNFSGAHARGAYRRFSAHAATAAAARRLNRDVRKPLTLDIATLHYWIVLVSNARRALCLQPFHDARHIIMRASWWYS